MKKSILDFEIRFDIKPHILKHHNNIDCQRLLHDLHFGTHLIGDDNATTLRFEGLTTISWDDKEFLKYIYLASEHDTILRDRLELLLECYQQAIEHSHTCTRVIFRKEVLRRYYAQLPFHHQESVQVRQTASCKSQDDAHEKDSDTC